MGDLLSPLLTLLVVYGYPVLAAVIILSCFGAPFPSEPLLLAAGSLTVDGSLNIYLLIVVVTLAAVTGDVIGYSAGRKVGIARLEKYTHPVGLTQSRVKSMEHVLQKYGGLGIYLTRWLLTPLGIPFNILCGISEYPLKKFLFFTVLGEVTWAGIYIYLGYLFGNNWTTLLDYIQDAPLVSAFAVLSIGALYLAIHLWRRR
jgi:membrane-associated protein